jgi:Glyoxalase/Bleomycin resistance protein/Dioxygenase superfamily
LPELKDDTTKGHVKLQHVAFEYTTIDDLLNSYMRIKEMGIEPVLTTDHEHPLAKMIMQNTKDGIQVVIELTPKFFSAWDLGKTM